MNPLFVASDGVEALRMLRTGEVPTERRLVLLDLNMPRMNGIELLRELRSDPCAACDPRRRLDHVRRRARQDRGVQPARRGIPREARHFRDFCELMVTLNKYWSLVEFP